MQFMNVNLIAVVASGLAAMGIGYLWYGPLFGKPWMRLTGLTQKDIDAQKPQMPKTYSIMFLSALIMAFILAIVMGFAGVVTVTQGFAIAFLVWLGFVATVKLSEVLFSGKPLLLYYIESGYYLVTFIAMSAILTAWK